jgi:hypothetical protein
LALVIRAEGLQSAQAQNVCVSSDPVQLLDGLHALRVAVTMFDA